MYRKNLGDPEDSGVMIKPPVDGRILHIEVYRGAIYFLQRRPVQDTILNFGTNAVTIFSSHVGMGQRVHFNDFVIMHHSLQPGRWLVVSFLIYKKHDTLIISTCGSAPDTCST